MEYHKHFIDIAESEAALLDVITSPLSNSIESISSSIFKNYKNDTKSSLVSKSLKLLRVVLCHQYMCNYKQETECKLSIKLNQFIEVFSSDQSKENLSVVSDIVILIIVLNEDKKSLIKVIEDLKIFQESSQSENSFTISVDQQLKIYKYFLMSLELLYFLDSERKLTCINSKLLESIKEVYVSTILQKIKIWFQCNDKYELYNLYYLLEKMIIISKSAKIINSYILEVLHDDLALTALCVLCDLLFPLKFPHKEVDYCLLHNKTLWFIIHNKIISSFPYERKQALYLFQKLSDFIEINEENIRKNSHCLCSEKFMPFICQQKDLKKLSLNEVKTSFTLIMEALEEKQQHLIVPIIPLVNNLIEVWTQHKLCGDCFHFNWIYSIFVRILEHDSNIIIKWGLLRSLKLDAQAYKCDLLLILIIKTLNNTYLYEKFEHDKEPQIINSLTTWYNNLQNENFRFIEKFINLLNQVQWGPIAIFHVLQSILLVSKKLDSLIKLEQAQLSTIRLLLMETNLKWHSLMLRSMSQVTLIEIFLRFSDIQNLKNVFNFLSNFSTKDIKEPSCWFVLTSSLSKVEYNNAFKFIAEICAKLKNNDEDLKIPVSTFSVSIQSLYEGKVIFQTEKCLVVQELTSLFLCLDKVDIRPYVKTSFIIKVIDLIHSLVNVEYTLPKFIYMLFDNYQETLWKFLTKLLNCDDFQYEHIETCTQILVNIILGRIPNVSVHISREYETKLEEKCLKVLNNNFHQCNQVKLLYALKLWSSISHLHTYENEFFYEFINKLLKLCQFKIHENELSRKISSECHQALSLIIHNHVISLETNDLRKKNWFHVISFILDAAGNEVLIYFPNVLRHCALHLKNDSESLKELEILIRSFCNVNFGSKRDKLFWMVSQNLTKCINSPNFMNSKSLQLVSQEFSDQMLKEGDKLPGLKYILLIFSNIDNNFHDFTNLILNGLLHGQTMRRDQRINLQTCLKGKQILSPYELKDEKIKNLDAYDFLNRQCNVDVAIRAVAILQFCKAISINNNNAASFLPLVLEKLLAIEKKRYFANSYLHRLKHRIMQVLLIIQPYLDQNHNQILYYALKDSVLHDSEQYSVLLLKKWIFIRIYLSNKDILCDLWPFFDKICEERPNSASFMIGIIWHIAKQLNKKKLTIFVKKALTKLGSCCMGQQFNMRLYGQFFFIKLYELLLEDSDTQNEFVSLYKIILDSLSSNNSKKHPVKIDDFFYTTFNPVEHYSLETIYHQLPRLSNVGCEEWITRDDYEEVFLNKSFIDIKIYNTDNSMFDIITPISDLKQAENFLEDIDLGQISTDIQKKIMPKKSIVPNEDEIEQIFNELDLNDKKKSQNIIVVASLVEKSQNLGGIARTCEIFGSKELIVSNLKQIEDKEFQALSVSADRWLKIYEIKPDSLCKHLLELKENGWSIIGAEQTVNSVSLINFQFPNQTVLILGNEKNGIPANILPLLDICVEIPQLGVVRSLNVHVTSAICIWEYIKQHQFK